MLGISVGMVVALEVGGCVSGRDAGSGHGVRLACCVVSREHRQGVVVGYHCTPVRILAVLAQAVLW